ncbi:MAG TPA: cytochrome-c peroxidase, partial [Bacteroidia bacterium]
MKKVIYLALAFLTVAISYNCKKSLPAPDPGNVKLYLPEKPYNYAAVREGNSTKFLYYEDGQPVNDDKATLGRVLFYDKALSLNSTIACASCHIQANGFADRTSFSVGFEEKLTLRNSMSICNLTEERNVGYFWDGRRSTIRDLVMDPVANHIEMGFDRIDLIATKINKLPYYADLFKKAYGTTTASEDKIRESMG